MDLIHALDKIKKIHFIGIGGISMSALAVVMAQKGYSISGSDMNESKALDVLRQAGAKIYLGHKKENMIGADLVVYTAAVKEDNEELAEAKKLGIMAIERSALLGYVIDQYKLSIGVSGTHGKTTVTSMISTILLDAKKDPTIMVGGDLPIIGGNLRVGESEYLVFESCEYSNSFLNFKPFASVILNIEADHLDFFKDLEDIINAFSKYALNTKEGGFIVANVEDENVLKAVKNSNCRIVTFGIDKGDYTAENIIYEDGYASYGLIYQGEKIANIKLNVPGKHNVLNSLAAFAATYILGVDVKNIEEGLKLFTGTKRRFELKYKVKGITIVDDYAHHPTEIEATLKTAKTMKFNRVICVFQPHTYTRTKSLLDDFVKVLTLADIPILAKIYPAREQDIYNVSSKDIADKIEGSIYLDNFESITDYLKENAKEGDLILTMGAGDITNLGEQIFNALS